jgi:DNA-binding response OmpR family regulator
MVEALLKGTEQDRSNIIYALQRMDRNIVPPLLAALDMEDPKVKSEIVGILERRAETAAVPFLWHLAASEKNPDYLRTSARNALAVLRGEKSLPPAKEMLTKEAEKYFQHQVRFPDSEVTVWRWDRDAGRVVPGWPPAATTVKRTQAEEYYGLKFAGQALDIDSEYKPAQLVFLSLVLEKAMERAGHDKPLAGKEPNVHDLLTSVNPELVTAVLERALADKNMPVILGAVRAVGQLGEVKAARSNDGSESALVRALNFPNPRVSFAAADALLRLPRLPEPEAPRKPGVPGPSVPAVRVVEVLRRAVAAEVAPRKARVLVVHNNVGALDEIDKALKAAEFEAVTVRTGKEGLRRLNQAADIDAIFVDWAVPDPPLAHFLGQVRSDVNAGLLPVLVLLPPQTLEGLRAERARLIRQHDDWKVKRLKYPDLLTRREALLASLKLAGEDRVKAITKELLDVDAEIFAAAPEREQEIAQRLRQVDVDGLSAPADPELSLRRMTERYRNVHLVPAGFAIDAEEGLKKILPVLIEEAVGKAADDAELKARAEQAVAWLAKIARGEKKGFDARPAGDTVIQAVRSNKLSPEATVAALEVLGRLPGEKAQLELANVIADPKYPVPVRVAAGQELVRHVQDNGVLLQAAQVKPLVETYAAADTDPALRAQAAVVIGSLRPDAKTTGDRLKGFVPAPPQPPPPPPPPKEPGKDR